MNFSNLLEFEPKKFCELQINYFLREIIILVMILVEMWIMFGEKFNFARYFILVCLQFALYFCKFIKILTCLNFTLYFQKYTKNMKLLSDEKAKYLNK